MADEVVVMSKLELYRSVKHQIEVEQYVNKAIYLSRQPRRLIAITRGGVLHIRPRYQRLCRQCDMGQVEEINHFIIL